MQIYQYFLYVLMETTHVWGEREMHVRFSDDKSVLLQLKKSIVFQVVAAAMAHEGITTKAHKEKWACLSGLKLNKRS